MGGIESCIVERDGGALIHVRVQPNARSEGITGVRGGRIVVRISQPAREGKANKALVKCLAKAFDIAPSSVEVVKGIRGRDKSVLLKGVEQTKAIESLSHNDLHT